MGDGCKTLLMIKSPYRLASFPFRRVYQLSISRVVLEHIWLVVKCLKHQPICSMYSNYLPTHLPIK